MLARESKLLQRGLVALLLVGGLWAARGAGADELLTEAKRRYEQGSKLFEDGKFVDAAQAFEEAYRLTPRSILLYDAAQAFDRGGVATRAYELYQAYLLTIDNPREQAQIKDRLSDLERQVALLTIRTRQPGARVVVDGKVLGQTPMLRPVPVNSGLHQIDVTLEDMRWHREQEFAMGLSHTLDAELAPPPPPLVLEAKPNKRFAALLGLGAVVDVVHRSYPPSQAVLTFGFDYRLMERGNLALDVSARLPVELTNGWTNVAILPGLRLVLVPSAKVPLEIVPSVDLGLTILQVSAQASYIPCPNGATSCLLAGFRVHPSLNLVYHFLPDWELRAELFGVTVDIVSPLPDPRLSFGLSGAWRFH